MSNFIYIHQNIWTKPIRRHKNRKMPDKVATSNLQEHQTMNFKVEKMFDPQRHRWPIGWYHEFGKYNFSYLVGVRPLLDEHIAGSITKRVHVLEKEKADFADAVSNEVWSEIEDQARISRGELLGGMNGIGTIAIRSVVSGRPAAFAKCLAVALMMKSHFMKQGIELLDFQEVNIKLAVFYIRNMKSILDVLLVEVSELALALDLNARTVEDIVKGYPTTFDTVSSVADYLNAKSSTQYASIDVYQSRVEIRDQTQSYMNRGRLAVARMEKPQNSVRNSFK